MNRYSLIHMHSPIGGACGRLAAKKTRKSFGTRVIYTAHGFHFYKGASPIYWMIFYPIEKFLSKYTDDLITINNEDYKIASRKFKSKKVHYVPGVGVDATKFNINMTDSEKTNIRKSLNIKENDFVMICVGELNKNKNQIMAINVVRELISEYENIKLLLVGKGPLEKFYEDEICKYNLQDCVKLLGYRNDIPKLLKISNVLLSLSYREGLPVNVIEAMISGLPVIVTDCRGNRDLVEDCVNGYILTNMDLSMLKEKIIKILLKKDNIKHKNIKKFYVEEIEKQIKKIYN